MFTYYLAFVLLHNPAQPPEILEGYKGTGQTSAQVECQIEADKQNRNNPIVRDPKVRDMGGEFVCLKMERLYV